MDPAGLAQEARDVEARVARGEPGAHRSAAAAWSAFALETWLREARGPARGIDAGEGGVG